MKKIFITVAEFLENGGELEQNREIYVKHRNGEIRIEGKVSTYYDGSYFYDDEAHSEYLELDNPHEFFVEIDCTPIYK